ncbi:MAG TPA: polysaccharide biosynthesis tyrosine autokinase [Flavipsychrobacter sp.]|nr:polysaccharide biosynthesis tyrosine autokinase [Flavipsychrobacter sp.]
METNPTQPDIIKQINTSVDFKRLLGMVVTNWYWFVFSLAISLFIAFLYLRYTTAIYSMESTLLIEQRDVSPASSILTKFSGGNQSGGDPASDPNLFNEIYVLGSQDLLKTVVDSLGMNIQYFMQGRVKEEEVYEKCPIKLEFDSLGYLSNGNLELHFQSISDSRFELQEAITQQFPFGTWISRPYGRFRIVKSVRAEANFGYLTNQTPINIRVTPLKNAADLFSNKLRVDLSDGRTSMVQLKFVDNIPRRGLDFLNALIYFYRLKELENLNLSAEKTRAIVEQYKRQFTEQLKSQDSAAADIRLKNNVVDIQAQAGNIFTQKTIEEQTIQVLIAQRQSIAALKQNILFGAGAREEVIAGVGVKDEYLGVLIAEYNTLVQKKEAVLRNTAPLNPAFLKLREDIDALRNQIADACDRVSGSLSISIQNATNNIEKSDVKLQALPSAEIDIAESKREYPVLTELYLYIYQRGVENDIKQFATTNKSKVVVIPFASDQPIKPIGKNVYAILLFLGILLPASVIIGKVLLNNKVINENDVEGLTTIPIIGAIARAGSETTKNKHIVVGPHVRTAIAEQFRLIRANLEFMSAGGNKKIYLITSSMSGEGKTFISLNLGLTMTLAKKRVVIMEFDLRKPKLTNYLGLQTDGGISGYLAGIGGIANAVKPSGVHENLYIANCGPIPPNPGELLVLPTTKQLIEELSEMFDVVIMDTAPIGLVSDALILSQFSDINMFVVRQSYTIKEQIKLLDSLYRERKIRNAGILFNGVEYLKKYGYGSGYGYGNSYGYGDGYYTQNGTSKNKKKRLWDFLVKK